MAELRIQYATTTDGVSIAWGEAGEGPAVLHCQTTPFSHVQESFAIAEIPYGALARSCRLIMFDARGTGMSERNVTDVSTGTLLLDAQAVIDAAKLDRFVVIADMNLMALWTALHLATGLPERVTHLVLESPIQNMRELADTPYGRTALALAEADWAVYTQTFMRVLAGWDADSAWVEAAAAVMAGWTDPTLGVQYMKLQETVDVGDILADVRQPTLVLRNDPTFIPAQSCQRIAAKIRGAQFRQYSDPNYEQWAGLIREFVGISAPSASADALAPEATVKPAATGGMVTILFTDIEGSTTLTQRVGDAAAQRVVRAHNTVVRDALRNNGGSETKHTGDGIMASFPLASGAIEAAIAIQRTVAAHSEAHPETAFRVRIGLNAGEPVVEEEDLFGTAVQLARRVCDHSEAGTILVTDVVRQLAAGKRYLFADGGPFVAKGFEEPVRLFEVRWRDG
jgi:class 3 adenylate cyclase